MYGYIAIKETAQRPVTPSSIPCHAISELVPFGRMLLRTRLDNNVTERGTFEY